MTDDILSPKARDAVARALRSAPDQLDEDWIADKIAEYRRYSDESLLDRLEAAVMASQDAGGDSDLADEEEALQAVIAVREASKT